MHDEEQLFLILHILINNKTEKFYIGNKEQLPIKIENMLGKGAQTIINYMAFDLGLLKVSHLDGEVEVTKARRNQIWIFEKKKTIQYY